MAVYKIVHTTKYQYNLPIKESINEIRLFPHNFENQDVLQHQLTVTNNPQVSLSQDCHGNRVGVFNTLEPHSEMTIESSMLVRVNHSLQIPEIDNVTIKDIIEEKEKSITLLRFSYPENIEKQDEIEAILKKISLENKTILALAQDCNQYVYNNFAYTKGITNINTTLDEVLELKKGVCQDFAHILLQLMRTAGVPARYVSGYICPKETGLRGEGATHAWVEIYSPVQGWLGLDPTNNIWVMDTHVKLAVGLNFNDCTPVKGTFKGLAKQSLAVSVSIGYENGRHYEQVNNVQLEKVSTEVQEELDKIDKLQQQEQQQQ